MKKYVQLYNDITGLPLTGKAIRLIRDGDGVQVDLAERGTSGVYRSSSIEPGIYSVWDVTSTPVDLDQKVDVLSSLAKEPLLTTSTATKFLDATKTWRVPGISDISGLSSALNAKEPTVSTGTATHAYFGNKAFRAITLSDISDVNSLVSPSYKSVSVICTALNVGVAHAEISGVALFNITEVVKSHAYVVSILFDFGSSISPSGSAGYPKQYKPSFSWVSGDIIHRFLVFLQSLSYPVIGALTNTVGTTSVNPSGRVMFVTVNPSDINDVTFTSNNPIISGESVSCYSTGVING